MEQAASLEVILWTTAGALVTLFTFSFLYKDNPLYKIAEHLVVGISAGYFAVLLILTNLWPILSERFFNYTGPRLNPDQWPKLFGMAFTEYGETIRVDEWWYVVPILLGMAMWTRFSKKYAWVSRYPIALYIGIASGVSIPMELRNRVVAQLEACVMRFGFDLSQQGFLGVPQGIWDAVVIIGVIGSLIYFFFSKEHKGAFGVAATLGIYTLMIGFGASFGYTVMARISLFIQRIQYLRDWVGLFG